MALKSKPPLSGASRGSKRGATGAGETHDAGVKAAKPPAKGHIVASAETIEARLERKATIADTKAFATKSLGQLSRDQRHKLLYGA